MDRRQFCRSVLGAGTMSAAGLAAWAYTPPAIRWHKDLKPAYRVAVQQNRPLLILFSASWCTFCHKLQRETLGEKAMITYVEQKFVPLLLDFEKDAHVAKVLEVDRLPCTVILSPQADLLAKQFGFLKADAYKESLQAALDVQQKLQQTAALGG